MRILHSEQVRLPIPAKCCWSLKVDGHLQAVEMSTVTFIAVPPLPHVTACVLVDCCPGVQDAVSVVIKQFCGLSNCGPAHWPVKALLLSTTHRPRGTVDQSLHVRLPEAC
jgi:hypothetical protein